MHALQISLVDIVVIAAYFALVIAIGVVAARKSQDTVGTYFLAGNGLRWPIVGAALFATNISSIHLVGLAAGGYQDGLVIGNFEWMAVITLIVLALVFAPRYLGAGIKTVPEFLENRYNRTVRLLVATINILAALLIHIGISLYAGSEIIEAMLGIPAKQSIVAIALLTFLYTATGGLRAVVWTETLQTGFLLAAALLVTVLMVLALPDFGIENYEDLSDRLRPGQLQMLQPIEAPSGGLNEYSWLAVMLGYPVLGVWYWCTDQTIVQRALGAQTKLDAQYGALFCALLKILPVFFLVMPGVLAYAIFANEIGADANRTYSVILAEVVPVGLRGLIVAGLLAALMSTVAGAIHSCSTTIALDILPAVAPKASQATQVNAGRVASAFVIILAAVWSTQGDKFDSIFQAINKIPVAFAPPIVVVFLCGVLWRSATARAALATLLIGIATGLCIMLSDLPIVGETRLVTDAMGIPYMLQAWILFLANLALFAVVAKVWPGHRAKVAADDAVETGYGASDRPHSGRGWLPPNRLALLLILSLAVLYLSTLALA